MHSIGSRCDFLLQKYTTQKLQPQILMITTPTTTAYLGWLTPVIRGLQCAAVCCSSVVTCSDPPHSVHFLIPHQCVASSSGQLLHSSPCQHNQERCPHCPPHIACVDEALRLYYCTQGLCRLGLDFFSNGPENIYLHQTK